MNEITRRLSLLTIITMAAAVLMLAAAQPARAAAAYTIQDNATGGQCSQIGTWNSASKTCTLTRDINVSGSLHAITIDSTSVNLDGAGHSLTFTGTPTNQYGVQVSHQSDIEIRNLEVKGFRRGISLSQSNGYVLKGNRIEANTEHGLYIFDSDGGYIGSNTIMNNLWGLHLEDSATALVQVDGNNFVHNTRQAYIQVSNISFGLGNYWSDFDSRQEGCVNNAPFDFECDSGYAAFGSIYDSKPLVLKDIYNRNDWTWYDDAGGDNWVLLGNNTGSGANMLFDLSISGLEKTLATSAWSHAPGYVPPGSVIFSRYPGTIGGPVTATGISMYAPITSQRILWPRGGNSLEEVSGMNYLNFDSRLLWTWYDNASPGYQNWVLISNPNDYQINYNIKIAGNVVSAGTIPAGGRVTPQFPGVIGGPVEANAWNSFGDQVLIMGSQRVLSNNGAAFNEQPGMPARFLSSYYSWTWYDMTGSAQDWVLIANPPGAASSVYYEVWIGGARVKNGGPIAPGGNETPTFPGRIGGPVEAKCFSNAAHTVPASCIASQRIIWGPSFGEVMGKVNSFVSNSYRWTWYDEASAGARNWVLVASKPDAPAPLYYEVWIGNARIKNGGPIPPGGNETPEFPGRIGGPVEVRCFANAAHTVNMDCVASQRVLWNGHFNELWGQ